MKSISYFVFQRFVFLLYFVGIMLGSSCKCKQPTAPVEAKSKETTPLTSNENSNTIQGTGKISLQYKSSCGTVIISNTPAKKDTLILIPVPALTGFDTEGMEVSFSYRKLRVHNPKGCAGIPVQLSNITH